MKILCSFYGNPMKKTMQIICRSLDNMMKLLWNFHEQLPENHIKFNEHPLTTHDHLLDILWKLMETLWSRYDSLVKNCMKNLMKVLWKSHANRKSMKTLLNIMKASWKSNEKQMETIWTFHEHPVKIRMEILWTLCGYCENTVQIPCIIFWEPNKTSWTLLEITRKLMKIKRKSHGDPIEMLWNPTNNL